MPRALTPPIPNSPRSIKELLYTIPVCHPDGAVFWRRRTYATLPAVLMRPETAKVLRPARSAGHQDDTAVDYVKKWFRARPSHGPLTTASSSIVQRTGRYKYRDQA